MMGVPATGNRTGALAAVWADQALLGGGRGRGGANPPRVRAQATPKVADKCPSIRCTRCRAPARI